MFQKCMYFKKEKINILVKDFSKTSNFFNFDIIRDTEGALKKLK